MIETHVLVNKEDLLRAQAGELSIADVVGHDVPPALVAVLQKAQALAVGHVVLVRLFEWFFEILENAEKESEVPVADVPELVDLLARATKFGLRAWTSYEEIFNAPSALDEEEIDEP